MTYQLLLVSGLALVPALSMAQAAPRLYFGASASLGWAAPFASYSDTHVGPSVTVGVAFDSRWGLELDPQLYWTNRFTDYDYLGSLYKSTSTLLVLPLLARYTATEPGTPLQVDLLGGVSWLHSATHLTEDYTSLGQAYHYEVKGSSNDASVTVGPQLLYAFSSHFDAKLNLPFNVVFTGSGGSFNDRLLLTPQLGVQYTFGE